MNIEYKYGIWNIQTNIDYTNYTNYTNYNALFILLLFKKSRIL